MSQPLEDVLHYENLISIATATKGLRNTLPPSFLAEGESSDGNTGTYNRVEGNRTLARYCAYNAPAKASQQQGVTEVPFTMIHNRDYRDYKTSTLINLRSESSPAKQKKGMETVARQTKNHADSFWNARYAAIALALANGEIHIGSEGQLLASSSGAKVSIDYNIPAGNQAQLDILGAGDTLNADWTSAAGDIFTDMQDVFEAYGTLYGGELKYAFYGANIAGYLKNNTGMQSYVSGDPTLAAQVATGRVLPNYFGLEWIPMKAYWEDEDGDIVDAVDGDSIVFCQEPDPEWWEVAVGGYIVPTDINVASDAASALNNTEIVNGMFSYTEFVMNPPTIRQYMGDTFMPLIKAPKSILQAVVPTA